MCALSSPAEAVVICTRNRPDDLKTTLESVATQSGATTRSVVVVDGSDSALASETAVVVENWSDRRPFYYHRYSKRPAGTRQRNTGVDLLPSSVEIVHFIDDDVTLKPGYFETLSTTLQQFPSPVGVGDIVESENGFPPTVRNPHSTGSSY